MKTSPISSVLDTPVEYVKGIGPARAELLKSELGIYTFGDLLTHYPFRYVDRTRFYKIREISEDMPYVQLRGTIEHLEITGQKKGKRLRAVFSDDSGTVELVWFQGQQWMAERLKTGVEYVVFGKASLFNGRLNFAHPEVDLVTPEFLQQQSSFEGVYSSTEKLKLRWLGSDGIRKLQRHLLQQLEQAKIQETLSPGLINHYQFISNVEAYKQIHFPESQLMLEKARLRLKFEELFFIQLRLLRLKSFRQQHTQGWVFNKVGAYFNTFFYHHLPFQLTGAQKRVLKEIHQDLKSGKQMNRLLQGDVGSGKTLVALMSMLLALDNGYQACLMAPTEILARQHFATFSELLKTINIEPAILTGSSKTRERQQVLKGLASGEIKILLGTHALLEDKVKFHNLGLAVIDEQHRFGVEQRARLHAKNVQAPHMLVMTATPIPRTLAMTFYGDLDTSVIDEMPPGRKPIQTHHYTESSRLKVIGFLKQQIKLGRQIYIVYPLIQESEKMDYQNLQMGYDQVILDFPAPQYRVSIVHGKLSNEQKEKEMQRFIKGETQLMVATTVIEVGVNVPNASVMVIESAERFGLSQLHQLRGRVGRGAEQSYCILMTGYKLGSESRQRMQTMVKTNDGFEISEVDLKLRGPGDIEGTAQSGMLNLKLADLSKDTQLVQLARQAAGEILSADAELNSEQNAVYKRELLRQDNNRTNWSKIA